MVLCELCGKQTIDVYGSGRFCSPKCARGFATKAKRQDINQQVSQRLSGRKTGINRWRFSCEKCSRKFRSVDSLNAHRMHCIYGGPKLSPQGRKRRGWALGLTKKTDARLASAALKMSLSDAVVFTEDSPHLSSAKR